LIDILKELAPVLLSYSRNGIIIFIDKLADQETIITTSGRTNLKKVETSSFP